MLIISPNCLSPVSNVYKNYLLDDILLKTKEQFIWILVIGWKLGTKFSSELLTLNELLIF